MNKNRLNFHTTKIVFFFLQETIYCSKTYKYVKIR